MAPLKSSFNRSAGKLLSVFNQRDLGKDGLLGDSEIPVAPNPPVYDETYILIVAGGASGGSLGGGYSNSIGGGGGGGVLHNVGGTAITVSPGVTYTITVGEGGAQVPNSGPEAPGNNGSNSTVSYPHPTGTKTWTATGGGRGVVDTTGIPGGSGGGGSAGGHAGGEGTQGPQPTPIGTLTGYGNDGGEGAGNASGGGGGGAGAVGQDGQPTHSGDGGAGTPVNISGTALYYGAGGGSGGSSQVSLGGEGGSSGTPGAGGDGGNYEGNDTDGANNYGAGGGAGGSGGPNSGSGGEGGDGVVIFRIPVGLAQASSHTNRSSETPVPSTGGNPDQVIWTWNGPGSFTVG